MEERVEELADSSDDESSEESASCKAFQNYIIMQNIMKRLDFDDLKSCRAVNRTWNYISSDIMKTLDCCQVQLKYVDEWDQFYKLDELDQYSRKAKSAGQNVSQLHQILENSINFPATDFLIRTPRSTTFSTEGLQLVKFFKSHGHKIRTLTLSLRNIQPPDYELCYNLLSQIPNIENLNFLSNSMCQGVSGELCFPKLKRFTWLEYNNLVSFILRNSPNLEIVESYDMLTALAHIVKAGKTYAIKSLVCHDSSRAGMMSLIQAKPQIEELTFRYHTFNTPSHMHDFVTDQIRNFHDASQLLIQANSQTLRQLVFSRMPCTHRIALPKLPLLTRFTVGINFRETCFLPGTNLLDTFPNLHMLDLSVLSRSKRKRGNLQSYFPAPPALIGNLPTVLVLEISSSDLSLSFMRRLHTSLCPNFKKLVIHDKKKKPELRILPITLEKVFKVWKHLTSIEIKKVEFGSTDLDSILTGIPYDEVQSLYEESGVQVEVPTFRSRKKCSVIFLKALKNLTFIFRDSSPGLKSGSAPLMEKPFLFSHVACSHTFNLMPRLNVSIIWDHKSKILRGVGTDLKSFGPNLTFLRKRPKQG